jgi:hypothetical protein
MVHVYAQCWNEAERLPFFFRHYDRLVDRYFIYDDCSDDGSSELLRSHPKVEARRFKRTDPDSFVRSEQAFSNACWKESRGIADWVIVTDVDEFLVHDAMSRYLEACTEAGVTLIPSLGFQMISETEPGSDEDLARSRRFGAPWVQMMKPSLFAPDAITEIDFLPGRHSAEPQGRVVVPLHDEVVLLHYKYLGFQRAFTRHRALAEKLGPADRANGWGHKYSWSLEQLREDWDAVARDGVDWAQAMTDPDWEYPIKPWWDSYRRAGA